MTRTFWQVSYVFVREGPQLVSREWTRDGDSWESVKADGGRTSIRDGFMASCGWFPSALEALRDRLPDAVRYRAEAQEWLDRLERLMVEHGPKVAT